MPDSPITNFKDSDDVDLGKKLVTKDYLLEVYGTILENSPASGLIITPELWVWGIRNEGRLGTNSNESKNTPVTTFAGGNNWKQVAGGFTHTAAIKTDGSLWTWGQNDNGQLGISITGGTRSTPVTTFAGGNDWKSVFCGGSFTGAIKTDGSLWTWGNNGNGQLGINNTDTKNTPVTTFAGGNNWKSVAAVYFHTAAIKTDGSLWTWGRNNKSQLGINNTDQKNIPVTTFTGGTNWKSVACGGYFTTAIKTDGSLWVWGDNTNGRLGINQGTVTRTIPVTTFAGGNDWKSVSAQSESSAAIKTDGSLWTWGSGSEGKLGINASGDRSTPVTTFAGGNNWKQVSVGYNLMAAIKTDGSLWTWGANGYGAALGINASGDRSTPVTTFAGGNNWKQVAAGQSHIKAIQTIDYI